MVFIIDDLSAWDTFLDGNTLFGETTSTAAPSNAIKPRAETVYNLPGLEWIAMDVYVYQVGDEIKNIAAALKEMKISRVQPNSRAISKPTHIR